MNPIDETKLLGLIEGELDSASAVALRGQLADDPQTLARLARLETDRHELRSLPEPELPQGIRAQLESILARPMLMEAERPGAYRRQQRRLARQKRLKRLAAAASITLAIAAGVWMAAMFAVPQLTSAISRSLFAQRNDASESGPPVARSSASKSAADRPSPPSTITAVELAAITKSDDVVHHYLPQAVPTGKFIVDQPGVPRKAEAMSDTITVTRSTIAATFAIVMQSRDLIAMEQVMVSVVRETGRSTGLVRNFSYAEARRIEEEWRIADAGNRGNSAPMIADAGRKPATTGAPSMAMLADRVRERLGSQRESSVVPDTRASGVIIGHAQNGPSLEQQLDFSSQGATHTVVVSAGDLASLLGRLGQSSGQMTWLRMLPGESTAPPSHDAAPSLPTLNDWMQQVPQVRAAAERLARDHADSMVLVPVIVVPQK